MEKKYPYLSEDGKTIFLAPGYQTETKETWEKREQLPNPPEEIYIEEETENLPTVIQESYIRIFVDVMFKKFIENQIEAGFQEYKKRKHICINCDCYNICRFRPVRLMLQPCKHFN